MRKDLFSYDKDKNKAVLFFSASSVGDTKQLLDFGIKEILVSYYYIRKGISFYEDIIPRLKKERGLFMTDSGAFSFMGSEISPKMRTEEYWLPYLKEYTDWLRKHKDFIYVAANLDLDNVVGHDIVRKWNREYFEPLEKEGLHIVYVAHEDYEIGDPHALLHFREYCLEHSYVGINQRHKDFASKFYQMAKEYSVRIHGFAWTQFDILESYPFFSVDSTTWLGGVRYGTTYDYDGKNFRTIDYKHKYRRKSNRHKYEKAGVKFESVTKEEKRGEVNKMNLLGWMGFRKEFLKHANLKLINRRVSFYER